MEVRPGYKQTDVGVIPEAWEIARLGDISRIIRGASPRPKGDKRFYGGPVPRLMVEDVTRDGKTSFPQVDSLTVEGAARSRPCKRGTLTLVCSGTVGIPSFLGVDACIHDGFLAVVGIRPNVSSDYLYYQFDRLRLTFESSATHGGIFTNLTTAGVRDFVVPIPPTEAEQSAIATALSDLDLLLAKLDLLIAKKRDLKQASIQELLAGKLRLPGFQGEWVVRRLGDHMALLRNGVNSRAELLLEGRVRYLHYGDVHACKGAFMSPASLPYLPDAKAVSLDRLRDGDVIFADASEDVVGVGKSVELRGVGNTEVVAGLHTIVLRFDKTFLADGFKGYLQFCLPFAMHLRRLAAGTKVYATNRAHIASVEMRLPPVAEQTAIAAVLSDMEAELSALEARRDKTRALKQGMMQELLTGKTRLVPAGSADA